MLRRWLIIFTAVLGFQTASAQYFDLMWLIIDAAYTWDRAEVEVRATEFANEPAIMYGIRGGWELGDNFSSGLGVYYSNHTFDYPRSLDYYSMDYIYSSFYVAFHIPLKETLEISTPTHFGYGSLYLDGNAYNFVPNDFANMFVFEPGVMINWYPLSWLRVYAGGAFRFNMGTYTAFLRNHELSAPSGILGVGFGRY